MQMSFKIMLYKLKNADMRVGDFAIIMFVCFKANLELIRFCINKINEFNMNKTELNSELMLSVVVPVLNEAENIAPLISEICSSLDGKLEYEIIYVDDGSDDDTPEILSEIKSSCSRLRILRHKISCGQSTAITTGIHAAKAQWIATLDGDGQNDPADIPLLWEKMRENRVPNDNLMVVGYRKKRRDTWLKRLSSKIANAVRSSLLKDGTPDTGSGLKLFRKALFCKLPYFDHMHRFLPALVIRAGGRVLSVEVNHRERKRGESKYGLHNRLWVGIIDMFGVMWLQRRSKIPTIERKE
jgi:dolichol-phosphate mannosyltransferase